MGDSEDEERTLILRETEIYEYKVRKSMTREMMHAIKIRGYDSVDCTVSSIVKILCGYLFELGFLQSPAVLDAIAVATANRSIRDKTGRILCLRLRSESDILAVLMEST